jgi:CMP-N-acetylneuraminic acid synthetase
MLQRVIETAYGADLFDRIYVSSEDPKTLDLAFKWGACPLYCSTEYAHRDNSGLEDVLAHGIDSCPGYGEVCLLLATAVLLRPGRLRASHGIFDGIHTLVSVLETHSARDMTFEWGGPMRFVSPRWARARSQDCPVHVRDAGQFYWVNPSRFMRRRIWLGQEILEQGPRPYILKEIEVQDIDTLEDLAIAEDKHRRLNDT